MEDVMGGACGTYGGKILRGFGGVIWRKNIKYKT
jgi:hypothetical protein